MNKIYKFLIVSLFGASLSFGVSAQKTETYKWTSSNVKIERFNNNKQLKVSFSINPDRKIASQEMVYIYPALVSEDNSQQVNLEPVCIVGKKRAKVIKRSRVLKNKMHLPTVEEVHPAKFTSIDVERTVPFERWMAKARLVLREEVYGCAECKKKERERDSYATGIHLFSPEDYRFTFVEPKAVDVKRHEETFESKVNFEVARHELKRDYKSNATELARLDDFVKKALDLEGTTLDVVRVEGYASPEGGDNFNGPLSERRANVLASYVRNKYPEIKRTPDFKVKGFGSDWAGLRKAVEASDLSYKAQVIKAIDNHSDYWGKHNAIQQIEGGRAYDYLLANVYPPLRRTTFRMGYKVRPFTVEELPRIFAKKPELMSNQEHYMLAQQYIKQGKNPLPIFESAYRLYPEDVESALNYANALLQYDRKQADKAACVLQPFKSDLRTALPLAIAEHMQGNEEVADRIIEEAAAKGCRRAQEVLNR